MIPRKHLGALLLQKGLVVFRELWRELGAEKSELTKRQKVLDKFLEKLNSEKKSPKRRKKKKLS